MYPIDDLKYGQTLYEYQGLIISMEEKLLNARQKNPGSDYADAENKIRLLKSLRDGFMNMHRFNVVIDDQNFKVTKQFHIMDDKIKSLEKEVEQLRKANNF